MNLPFAFDEPFFDREVHAYDLRLAKALINNMESDGFCSHLDSDRDMDGFCTQCGDPPY